MCSVSFPCPYASIRFWRKISKSTHRENSFDFQVLWLMPVIQHFRRPSRQITRSGGRDYPDQHGGTLSLLKIQKWGGRGGTCQQSQLHGRLNQKNHLNPRGQRLQWAEIAPLHTSLGKRAKLYLKKKKETNKKNKNLKLSEENLVNFHLLKEKLN